MKKPDQTPPERLAAPMLPVWILGGVAIVLIAYFMIGTMVMDAERRQDDRAERQAEERYRNDD